MIERGEAPYKKVTAEAHTAREAVGREDAMRRELERVQAQLAAKESAYAVLQHAHSNESIQSTATTSSLETKLDEKEQALSEATLQNTTLRAELQALAKHQERLADAADHAREEAERARGAAKEGSTEYKAAVAAMTIAERDAAAARAAEAMARDFTTRTQSDIKDVVARESAAREDLVELRISHERLQQEFRDKTAAAVEKQSRAELVLMEERHRSEMGQKASKDRIDGLERSGQEAAYNIRQLTESLERQKQETYYLYTNYTQVATQLEDTKVALEREQEDMMRMHQGLAQQKMAIAGAAGAGMGVGGGGGWSGGGGWGGGGGGGVGYAQPQQRSQHLALPGASAPMNGGGMATGMGKPPFYPGGGNGAAGGLPDPASLMPSHMSNPGVSAPFALASSSGLSTITELTPAPGAL